MGVHQRGLKSISGLYGNKVTGLEKVGVVWYAVMRETFCRKLFKNCSQR